MSTPAITVVIPCNNVVRYLESALASVQAQTFTNFEMVVVDDGSTDSSKAFIDALVTREPRLRISRDKFRK